LKAWRATSREQDRQDADKQTKGAQEAMEKNKIIDKRSNDRLGIICPKPPAKADFISWTNGD